MFTGTVPFKGTNPHKVYADIKNRNIQWPEPEILEKKISMEGQDLINRMIQIDPTQRLGSSLDSMKVLKLHPFFEGIDFQAISKSNYKGLKAKIDPILGGIPDIYKEEFK